MKPNVGSITSEKSIQDAVTNHVCEYKHGGFPVVVSDKLKGIITVDDIRKISKDRTKTYVRYNVPC